MKRLTLTLGLSFRDEGGSSVDSTAPTLSNPLDAANGATAATGSVVTDEANGTLYWVVSTSATAPTAAQVKAGNDHTGSAAAADGSQSVTGTGTQTITPAPSGLSGSTAYTIHFMHEDAAGNQSGVASGDGFTTDAAPDVTAPTLSSPVDTADGEDAATGSVDTNEANGTLYWVVTTSATAPSAAQVKAGQDNSGSAAADDGSQSVSTTGTQPLSPAPSGLSQSTAYTIHFMHEDATGNQSTVVSGDGFTTGPTYGVGISMSFGTGSAVGTTDTLGPTDNGRDNWQDFTGNAFSEASIEDSDGSATTLDAVAANFFGAGASTISTDDTSDEYHIFNDGLRADTGGSTITLTDIPWPCDILVFYDERTGTPSGQSMSISDGTTTYFIETDATGQWAGSFSKNTNTVSGSGAIGNYVEFAGNTSTSVTITATSETNSNLMICGLQLVRRTDLFFLADEEEGNVPTFDTVAAMVAGAASLSDGTMADTRSHTTVGDGGGASWIITDGVSPPTADGITVHNLGGDKRASLARWPSGEYDVRSVGVFGSGNPNTSTSGADVSTRLSSLFAYMSSRGGGTIYLPENISCANTVFEADVSEENAILFKQKLWTKIFPSNPVAGTYVWDFPTTGTNLSHVFFEGIYLRGESDFSTVCNGIRVGPINQGRMVNCRAHFIVGTAFYISGYNNSRVDLTTFKCGQASSGRYAQVFTASSQKGNTCNDIVYSGATERDELGISFEGTHLLRTESSIKLHGGDEVRRALRVLRCLGFDLEAICSQNWGANSNSEFIWIGDNGNVGTHGEVPDQVSSSVPQNTNGRLTINTMHNVSYQGTGTGNWCVVDLGASPSQLKLEGLIRRQTGGAANIIQIDDNQTSAIFIDDSLKFDPGISVGNQTTGSAHQ